MWYSYYLKNHLNVIESFSAKYNMLIGISFFTIEHMFHILGFTQGAAEVIRTCLTAFYMHFAHTLTSRFCVHRYQFPFQCQSTGSQIYYGIVGQEVDFTPESGAILCCIQELSKISLQILKRRKFRTNLS